MPQNWLKTTDHSGGVTELCLSRGPVNALTPAFLDDIANTVTSLAKTTETRAILLTSGCKVFCAGLDLKEAQTFDLNQQHAIVRALNTSFTTLFACPKPVICVVNGPAIAGGAFFPLIADHRIATPHASIGLAEVRVGATLPTGPMEIARATLDPNTLRRLVLSGQPISADQAQAVGIFDEISDPADLFQTALIAAQRFAVLPAKTYASAKNLLRGETISTITQAMENGANTPSGGWFNNETTAAMAAMLAGKA